MRRSSTSRVRGGAEARPLLWFWVTLLAAASFLPAAAAAADPLSMVGRPITGAEADASAASASATTTITPSVVITAMDPLYGQILADHNTYRAKHQAPPLTWDDAAAARAKITVDSCVFAHQAQGDGENIAATTDTNFASALAWAIKAW